MLDVKILRTEPEKIKEALKKRNNDLDITPAIELDQKRREILYKVEQMKAQQNEITKKIPAMKKAGENTDAIFAEMKELSNEIKVDDDDRDRMRVGLHRLDQHACRHRDRDPGKGCDEQALGTEGLL